MTKPRLTITALAASVLFAFVLCAPAPGQTPQGNAEKGAAVFKIPDGWMPAPDTEVGPMVMLNPKKPAVMFVTYPKPEEKTTEAQRQRLRTLAAGMFFHDDKTALNWETKRIPSHPGDGDGAADIATAKQGDMEVQIVTYERTTGVRPFIYGYIAMRNKKSSAPFIDETGKGSKDFDKLWKSFPN